jgi:hypothetical protein
VRSDHPVMILLYIRDHPMMILLYIRDHPMMIILYMLCIMLCGAIIQWWFSYIYAIIQWWFFYIYRALCCAERSSNDDSPIYTRSSNDDSPALCCACLYSSSSLWSSKSEAHCRCSLRLTFNRLLHSVT